MVSIFPEDPKNSALPQRHALWSHHPSSLKAHRTSVFGRHSMHPALKGVRSPGQFTKQLTSSGKNCKVGKPINSYSYNSITVMGWWYYDYCSPMVDDTMTMDDYSYNSIIIGQTCGPQLSSKSHDIHRHQDLPTSKIYCEDSIHQLIQEETIIHKYNIWLVVDLPLWKIWLRQLGLFFRIYGKIKNVPNHQPVYEMNEQYDVIAIVNNIIQVTITTTLNTKEVVTSLAVWVFLDVQRT